MPQHELHPDTLFHVMEYIGLKDGLSCVLTCKNWYQLDRFEMVWKTLLSNWLLLKIDYYEKMMESCAKNSTQYKIYRNLADVTRKFHTTQILNEKKVNKHSFMEFMDRDEDEMERSTVFGTRFKKLIPSALNANFSLMMSKGLEEISKDFQPSVVEYIHTGVIAQYFLSHAKKFTKDGRVMEGLRAQDYWKRFSKSIFNVAISELTYDDSIEFINKFKPIMDDYSLANYIVIHKDEEKLLKFIQEYISIDGNVEKSNDISKLQIPLHHIASSLLGLECWFNCMEIIYPGLSVKIFDSCTKNFGYRHNNRLVHLSESSSYLNFEFVRKYCEIVKVDKMELFSENILFLICRNVNDYELIEELYKHGLINMTDIKRILHTYTFRQANPMKLIKLVNDFDPYELEYFEGLVGPSHFVESFFKTYNCNIMYYFKDFYEEYGPFDLEKLMEKLNEKNRDISYYAEHVRSTIRTLFIYWYANSSEFERILETAVKCFKPSILGASTIEDLCTDIITDSNRITKEKWDAFEFAIKCIQINGVPFEEHCKTFYEKYPDCLDFQNCALDSEERLALLYRCCIALLNQRNKVVTD